MTYAIVKQLLDEGSVVVLDGPMGTELQRRGADLRSTGWSSFASIRQPDIVRATHADYITAGADVITTNTFAASAARLPADGPQNQIGELNRRSVELAIEARAQAGAEARVAIAGSISTGNASEVSSEEKGYQVYREQAQLLAGAGVDLIILEMLKDVPQARAAIAAAKQTGLPVWAGFSCKANDAGDPVLLSGEPGQSFADALSTIGPLSIDAATIMHTTFEHTSSALAVLRDHFSGPSGAYPHAGKWLQPDWEFDIDAHPETLTALAAQWRAQGSQIFGACCRLGVDYISALKAGLR
jgi:homocysteine S-methyltransferase